VAASRTRPAYATYADNKRFMAFRIQFALAYEA
jgi:hypothetical protein